MKKTWLYIAWIISLLAAVGSLFLSNGLHWTPCVLCWYQRIFMYPLVIILGVAILTEVTNVEYIVLTMSGIGSAIALYHNLLQYQIIPERLAPCTMSAPCTIPYHFYFNFLTIPLLSFASFAVIIICMLIFMKGQRYE